MNENLNLVNVLKNCPKGTRLYSPIYGVVELCNVHSSGDYPIVVSVVACGANSLRWFAADGRYDDLPDAECMLFPSKDCRDWSKFNIIPATWEEFCKTHPLKGDEVYVSTYSEVCDFNFRIFRNPECDKILLPNKKSAKAMIALCQLLQLRDCYNDGWKPDWHSNESKSCIDIQDDEIYPTVHVSLNRILVFKNNDVRDEFLKNFRHLIEVAKELL